MESGWFGGTRDKLVVCNTSGVASELGYQTPAGWKTLTVPIPELNLGPTPSFWSTDKWASVYMIGRDGALLQCPLK